MRGRAMVAASAGVAAAAIAVLWWVVPGRRERGPGPAVADTVDEPRAGAAPIAGIASAGGDRRVPMPVTAPRGTPHDAGPGVPPRRWPPPTRVPPFQLVTLGPTMVVVNHGDEDDQVSAYSTDPIPPTDRVLRGRVLGGGGAPVNGAVVVAGPILTRRDQHLWGSYGGTSGPRGRFEIAIPRGAQWVTAVTETAGWSPLQEVPAGADAIELELHLAPPGEVTGQVRRRGQPDVADVVLWAGGANRFEARTDEQGRYRIAPVPAGTYRMHARLVSGPGAPAMGAVEPAAVTVRPGEPATADFDIGGGVLLVIELGGQREAVESHVMVWLLPGHHQVPDGEGLFVPGMSSMGGEPDAAFQFEDREPGPYTACASTNIPPEGSLLGCAQFELLPEPDVQQQLVPVVAPPAE